MYILSCHNCERGELSSASNALIFAKYAIGVKKSSHLPSLQRNWQYRSISVLFPFNFRAVAILVRFQTVPILSQGQLVRSSERPGWRNYMRLVINSAGRLTAGSSVIVTELECELPSTVIEQENGSRQFSDRDRSRARAMYMYLARF